MSVTYFDRMLTHAVYFERYKTHEIDQLVITSYSIHYTKLYDEGVGENGEDFTATVTGDNTSEDV